MGKIGVAYAGGAIGIPVLAIIAGACLLVTAGWMANDITRKSNY